MSICHDGPCLNCPKFGQLILRKIIIELLPPDVRFLLQKYCKNIVTEMTYSVSSWTLNLTQTAKY